MNTQNFNSQYYGQQSTSANSPSNPASTMFETQQFPLINSGLYYGDSTVGHPEHPQQQHPQQQHPQQQPMASPAPMSSGVPPISTPGYSMSHHPEQMQPQSFVPFGSSPLEFGSQAGGVLPPPPPPPPPSHGPSSASYSYNSSVPFVPQQQQTQQQQQYILQKPQRQYYQQVPPELGYSSLGGTTPDWNAGGVSSNSSSNSNVQKFRNSDGQIYGHHHQPQTSQHLLYSSQLPLQHNAHHQHHHSIDATGQSASFSPVPPPNMGGPYGTGSSLLSSATQHSSFSASSGGVGSSLRHKPKLIRTATLSKDKHALLSGRKELLKSYRHGSAGSNDGNTTPTSAHSLLPTEPCAGNLGSQYANISVTITKPLVSALQNWSTEEIRSKRRLLLFDWTLVGNVLQVSFHPIAQHEYVHNSPVVSCIYWDYKNDYYITSVDVIFLLEQLSGNQAFDIKEKNRIRRNLQTMESLTIGKTLLTGDPEIDGKTVVSQSGRNFVKHTINPVEVNRIFDSIMKYDSPRPRRIEKDIKIYKWNLLEEALLRVLTKYCYNQNLG